MDQECHVTCAYCAMPLIPSLEMKSVGDNRELEYTWTLLIIDDTYSSVNRCDTKTEVPTLGFGRTCHRLSGVHESRGVV